jgi:hypothetical protein
MQVSPDIEVLRGKVTDVQFTFGGFGNQFTTIDGHRCWTWWDIREHSVRVGCIVTYRRWPNVTVWDSPKMHGDIATILQVEADQAVE